MNTPLFRDPRIDILRHVQPALHPLVWMEESAELDEENAAKMKKMLFVPLAALQVAEWGMVAAGAGAIAVAMTYFLLWRDWKLVSMKLKLPM
jgi:hypothetical protein